MHKKNRYKRIYYAKILIIIGIMLLTYGLILDVNNTHRLIDPVNNVIEEEKDNYVVHVDTNHGTISDDSDEFINNKNNYSDDVAVSTIDQTNEDLRTYIQNTYDITVKYGDETKGYSVGKMATSPIYDSTTINSQLNRLKAVLDLYPNGLFREIKNGGIPLTVVLINSYDDKRVTGVTDSNYSYAVISIAALYPFEESFYHESYHYIERFIFKRGGTYGNAWNLLSPSNSYSGDVNKELSYDFTYLPTVPFVNDYAQTSAEEDRASTFEYMMANTKASCLNNGNTVWRKAKMISDTIDAVFNTVNPNTTEYWERFL